MRRDPYSLNWPGTEPRNVRDEHDLMVHSVERKKSLMPAWACASCNGKCGQGRRCPSRERRPVHGSGIVLTIIFTLLVFMAMALVLVVTARGGV